MPEAWGSAEGYEYAMGRWSRVLATTFLEWARTATDAEVLDVGCGAGALSEALLARGASAVVGLDPSAAYVEYAASRVRGKGTASFQVGNAMNLPFPDNRFGAVVSGLVLNFVPDAARAVHEMRRVARPDAVVAACVWDYAGGMEMLRFFWDAAAALSPDARKLDEGVRFSICKPEKLANLFLEATLSRVETASLDVPMVFRNFDDYWTPFLGGQGPAGGYAMGLGEGERGGLRDSLQSRLPRRKDGSIALTARAWAVRGNKV